MLNRRTKNILVGLVTVSSLVMFVLVLVRAIYYAPTDEVPLPTSESAEVTKRPPERGQVAVQPTELIIPSIELNAKIVPVGITARGNMATPNNFADVGWYEFGPVPGALGSAVLAGHVNDRLNLPAVFGNLEDLKEGDDIYITTALGERLHFVVDRSAVYDFNARADDVFNESGDELLKLITCYGEWLPTAKTHDKRLVVTAVFSKE